MVVFALSVFNWLKNMVMPRKCAANMGNCLRAVMVYLKKVWYLIRN